MVQWSEITNLVWSEFDLMKFADDDGASRPLGLNVWSAIDFE